MKKLLWLITFLAVIFWNSICSADLEWYSILSYASNYVLDWSWNLSVEESINVNFQKKDTVYTETFRINTRIII